MYATRKLRIETLEARNLLAADASGSGVVDAADYVALRKSQATQAAFAEWRSEFNYSKVVGELFVDGPAYSDVAQGDLNDCGFLAALAETALRSPATITSMFVVNADGTYDVRFYQNGVADHVTVDAYSPTGRALHAGVVNGELWVMLAEKAFAQERGGGNYNAIEFMYAVDPLRAISGQSIVGFNSLQDESAFGSAYSAGSLLCFTSQVSAPGVVPNHVYAVVGYDAATQTVTLFNPWGINYGLTKLAWSDVQANFAYYDRAA